MAEPTEKSWWDKAKEQAGRAAGSVLGGAVGALTEIGSFGEELVSTKEKDFNPLKTFPEFARHLKDYAEGRVPLPKEPQPELDKQGKPLPPTKVMVKDEDTGKLREETQAEKEAGAGFKRVLQGTLGVSAPRGTGEEDKYKATPFYQAAKRDLLNIGEGLGGILSMASGFENEAIARAREENKKAGRPTGGFIPEAAAGGQAAFPTGQDIAGGFLAIPAILAGGLMEGKDGKRMIQEQPITYALNALPVLSRLSGAAKAGLLSKIQVAEINTRIGKLGIQGVSTIDDLNRHIKGITDQTTKAQVAEQAATATAEGVGAASKTFGGTGPLGLQTTAPALRAVKAATTAAETAVGKAPMLAAGYSLGGPVGAVLMGGALATPMLANFMRGTKTAEAVKAKTAGVKRKFVEPRTYETPEAQAVGEALLTTEGETAVISQKLQGVAEEAKQGVVSPLNPVEDLSVKFQQKVRNIQAVQDSIAEATRRGEDTTALQAELQTANSEWQQANRELGLAMGAIRNNGTIPTQYEIEQQAGLSKTYPKQVDFNRPENKAVLDKVADNVKGTGLEEIFDTPDKQQQLASTLVIGQTSPLLWLADENLRNRTSEKLVDGLKLDLSSGDKKTAVAIVNSSLLDINNKAYNNGKPTLLEIPQSTLITTLYQQGLIPADKLGTALNRSVSLPRIEDVVGNVAGKSYNPTNSVLTRVVQDFQTGMRQKTLAPFVMTGFADLPVSSQFDKVKQVFQSGQTIAPTAIDFDPTSLIKKLREEATLTTDPNFRGNLQYKKFLTETADALEKLKAPKVEMGATRVAPSVAGLPLQNQYDFNLNLQQLDPTSKALQGIKRLATIYNPMTGVGNYLGNAMVRMMDTGSPLPTEPLRQMANDLLDRVMGKTKPKNLTLQDELVLRAVPSRDILSAAESGVEKDLYAVEKTGLGKAVRTAYNYGDALFKLDKATTLSRNLLEQLPLLKEGEATNLRAGPDITLSVMRRGDTYTFINPENGKILTSGTLESPAVKRILGSSVKAVVDTLYPDVSQLPEYFATLAQGRGGVGAKLASAVVFAPFMSYVIKASDSPWKKGILSTLVEGNVSSPLEGKGFTGTALTSAGRYAASRALTNSMAGRFENLNGEEREALRQIYAFAPAKQKPLIFAGLVELDNGQQVPRFISPTFTNFWSYTDDTLRGFGYAMKVANNAFNKAEKDKELKGDDAVDEFTRRVLEGKEPTSADILRTAGVSGGMLLPLLVKSIESEKLGKQDITGRDILKPFGILGRSLEFAGEQTGVLDPKVNFNRPTRANVYGKLMDVFIGSQMTKEQTPEKATLFLNKFYEDQYKLVIQPLLDKAAAGDENYADDAIAMNDALKEAIRLRKESFNNAMSKIGVSNYIKEDDLRFRKPKVRPEVREVEEQTGETFPTGESPELPKVEGMEDTNPPPIPD